jgi:hypothetical protein
MAGRNMGLVRARVTGAERTVIAGRTLPACFIVRDSTGQALAYFYFEEGPDRRSADVRL